MTNTSHRKRALLVALLVALLAASTPVLLMGQGRGAAPGGRGAQPPRTPKAAAPVDLTGYWVSLVTEDWRWRMVTPLNGDSASVPINDAAKKIMFEWDPSKDEAAGNQCKAYGAPTIMRVPGRLHITWQDDNTLKIDTDSGTQTRLLHFGTSGQSGASRVDAGPAPSWQGYSLANWRRPARMGAAKDAGDLRVVTTKLRRGYLRKNGVPYSENASVEEFFDLFTEPNGDTWLVIDTIVTDPTYLTQPYVNSVAFKKERDGSKWDPTPCRADQPR